MGIVRQALRRWLEEPAHPTAIDPPVGRIWTANARVTSDPAQEQAIGGDTASLGAEYDFGARAAQIRADLLAIDRPATPADMLRIQLDDRAVFLGRWREVLLGLLDASSLNGHPDRAQFRSLIEHWDAAADTDSVGYRLVRRWRDLIEAQVWDMILDGLHIPADASYSVPTQFQAPLLQLLREQPLHLLPAPLRELAAAHAHRARYGHRAAAARVRRAQPLHLGTAEHHPHPASAVACPAVPVRLVGHADARAARRSRHAACSGDDARVPPSVSRCPPATKRTAISICRGARAAIRCHRTIEPDSWHGPEGCRCPSCPGPPQHRITLQPRARGP